MAASSSVATVEKCRLLQTVLLVGILGGILFKYLIDDGFSLSWRMVGSWWDVKVQIHWLLIGPCGDPAIVYSDAHVQKDHRLARLVCGPDKLAKRQ